MQRVVTDHDHEGKSMFSSISAPPRTVTSPSRCPFHKFAASQAAARLYGLGGYKARANR